MLLKQVTVENYGPFRGVHVLDLAPSPAEPLRPIVLIGGRNGTGKTSLLEAIRLCLYGRRSLGNPRAVDYYDHLRSRLHKGANGRRESWSSVCIEIEVVEIGYRNTYEVRRSWSDAPNMAEELRIKRDGEDLKELFMDQYQAFLDELMPPGLAELFFFDGERIQKLAEEDGSDRVAADSIRGLLGLQVTSQLQADIAVLMRTRVGTRQAGDINADIEEAQLRLKEVGGRIETLEAESNTAEIRNDSVERAIRLQEQKIASEGGDFARRREELLANQYLWQASLHSCEAELREMANDLMPFCLVPELCVGVRRRVEDEATTRREEVAMAVLRSKQRELLQALESRSFWAEIFGNEADEPNDGVQQLVMKAVSGLVKFVEPKAPERDTLLAHDLSERDQQTLLTNIEAVLVELPQKVASLAATAEEAHQRLLRVEKDLQRAPREEVLKPLLADLSQLQVQLSEVRREQSQLELRLRRARMERKEIERTLKKLAEQLHGLGQDGKAMTLGVKVRNVLELYEQELTVSRVGDLADCITECYGLLAHKGSLCSQVQIHPKTLAITLYNNQGDVVHRRLLSAGEKQVLAIAILWGLGRASGRQLPVIIDTPLARLDNTHRDRLLSRYFPKAGHQVILLSTDSEINGEGLDILRHSIAKAHHLCFDPEYNQTTIRAGYIPAVRDL